MKQILKVMIIALAILCSFSQVSEAKVKKTNKAKTQATSKSKGSWRVTSASDLEKRIVGTVWTCLAPTDDTWYRLEFHSDHMLLRYNSNPPIKKGWIGGGKENDKWRYEIVDNTNCVSVVFYKMDPTNDVGYGKLNFYRDGKVYFDWLRGRHGGTATCGDYNWK